MGAGASAEDKAELQRSYAAWNQATADGKPLNDEGFLALLKEHAPGLHTKVSAEGTGPAAAKALLSQFESAKRKLQMQALQKASKENVLGATPADPPPQPPTLQKLYSWAADKSTNLQRGLKSNAFEKVPLRLVDLSIADISIAALLDTGAEHSALSTSASERCGLKPLVDESFGGVAGGIGTTSKQGRVHYAKITVKGAAGTGVQLEAAFDVMEWPKSATFDAILGIDFLVRYKAIIDVCGNALTLVDGANAEKVQVTLRPE